MTLRNFDTPLDRAATPPAITPLITEEVHVTRVPSAARGFLAKPHSDWRWDDLRDYVVNQIERRGGSWPRDAKKEYGIFRGFMARHGERAPAIAEYAFEVLDGQWNGDLVSITRFCKGSDPYFAIPLLDRMTR